MVDDCGGLFFEELGTGSPFVVMHGGFGLDCGYFRPWLEPLAAHVKLILYDHPGNGRSEDPERWEDLSMDLPVRAAENLQRHLGFERVVVMGHSAGGLVAQAYARAFPERVRGLVLCSTVAAVDYLPAALDALLGRATVEQRRAIARLFGGEELDDDTYRRNYLTMLPLLFSRYRAAYSEKLASRTRFSGAAHFHSNRALVGNFDSRGWLRSLGVPALVLAGRYDPITPFEESGEALTDSIPGASLVTFDQSGHFPFMEEPEKFASAVIEWMERIPP